MKIWMGWLIRESGSQGYACMGDRGRAYGAYEFDYRYGLIPFLKRAVAAGFTEFEKYSKLKPGDVDLISNDGIRSLFVRFAKNSEFCSLQDKVAKENYYDPAVKSIKKMGVDPDKHSEAFRGTLFSMAIRSGELIAARKCNQEGSEEQILRKAYATYGNEDAGRWTESQQLGDALKALREEGVSSVAYDVNKLIKVAKSQIGYLEKASNKNLDSMTGNAGSGNFTKYWRDMKPSFQGQPWCDCFVDWCFVQAYGVAGAKYLECGGTYEFYTPTSAQYYKNAGQWHSTPKIGDQIFFRNASRICHTGIVIGATSTKVYTIEGNTSGASGVVANGGGVREKSYNLSDPYIAGYGRPNYGAASKQQDRILKRGMKGDDVKHLQKDLIALGYSCGSYGADGDFGSATEKALKAFQKDNKLTQDGEYGEMTKKALSAVMTAKKKKEAAKKEPAKKETAKKETGWKAIGTATVANTTLVNMRSEPKKADNVLRTLAKGNRFEVDGQKSGKWIHVKTTDNGMVGWIHGDFVKAD